MAHAADARQADICPEGTAFYQCAVGPFIGCCSHNPCDIGLCKDVDDCNSVSPTASQAPSPVVSEEQMTTLTVTVSEVIKSLTATVTVSDMVTSVVTSVATEPAASTLQAITSSPDVDTLASHPTNSPSSLGASATSRHFSAANTLTEAPMTSIPGTTATAPPHAAAAAAVTATTNSSKTVSSSITHPSPAISNSPTSQGSHTTAVVGGIAGALSLLALLALLLLCCYGRKRAKYSFSMKRKSKEDKEDEERAKLLRNAEEAALQRQAFVGTAISTGAQSPIKDRTADAGPSPYPRNSTAVPPQHWI